MISSLVNTIAPVFIIVLIGFFLGKYRLKEASMEFINYVNIHVFCPALVFSALILKPISISTSWPLIVGGILIILLPGILLTPIRLPQFNHRAFLVSGMFKNTGNIGIPLAVLAYGTESLSDIIILFVIANSLHFSLGLFLLSNDSKRWLWLHNPNIWAAFLGISLAHHTHLLPSFVLTSTEMLGQVTIPMMLFSLGVRLSQDRIEHIAVALKVNLLYLLTGAIAVVIIIWLLPLTPDWQRLLILAAFLPPAVLNFMLCEHYQASPNQVASVVLLGTLMAIGAIPFAIWLSLRFI